MQQSPASEISINNMTIDCCSSLVHLVQSRVWLLTHATIRRTTWVGPGLADQIELAERAATAEGRAASNRRRITASVSGWTLRLG